MSGSKTTTSNPGPSGARTPAELEEMKKAELDRLRKESENSQDQLAAQVEADKAALAAKQKEEEEALEAAKKEKDAKAIKVAQEELASTAKQIEALDIVQAVVTNVPNSQKLRLNSLEVTVVEQGVVVDVPYCMAVAHPGFLQLVKRRNK